MIAQSALARAIEEQASSGVHSALIDYQQLTTHPLSRFGESEYATSAVQVSCPFLGLPRNICALLIDIIMIY